MSKDSIDASAFLNERSDWKCMICLEIHYTNNVRLPCGHIFGHACIQKIKTEKCPLCRKLYTCYLEEKPRNREVQDDNIECVNHECSWSGTVLDWVRQHQKNCKFRMVKCSVKGCSELIPICRKNAHESDMEWHLSKFAEKIKLLEKENSTLKDRVKAWELRNEEQEEIEQLLEFQYVNDEVLSLEEREPDLEQLREMEYGAQNVGLLQESPEEMEYEEEQQGTWELDEDMDGWDEEFERRYQAERDREFRLLRDLDHPEEQKQDYNAPYLQSQYNLDADFYEDHFERDPYEIGLDTEVESEL